MPERLWNSLSGGPVGRLHLPWDKISLAPSSRARRAPLDFQRGFVCERAALQVTIRAAGTSGSASSQNASDSCGDGKPPSDSASDAAGLKCVRLGPRRHASSAASMPHVGARQRTASLQLRPSPSTRARGHAGSHCRPIFVIAPAVMNRAALPARALHDTAAMTAMMCSDACAIVNVST